MFPWEENVFVAHAERSNIYLHLKLNFFRVRDFQPNVCPGGVSQYDCGESLPYAPVDWPNTGDKGARGQGKELKVHAPLEIGICIFRSILRLQKVQRKMLFELDNSYEAVTKFKRLASTGIFGI
ncbi:hypothetical protein KY290_037017 [Solanum tuberosum]|uniref:Uncharacterized protein n=1 Tax=Solanum tuberosum TaxID=4113 RepID=A0ABQ7TUB1_SOLTU|nr:hypothetical protein KY289_036509 [Solanum tuberosum]KAH0738312.1 hypothetical protein KY290_037017 [Solanum tuberosum]